MKLIQFTSIVALLSLNLAFAEEDTTKYSYAGLLGGVASITSTGGGTNPVISMRLGRSVPKNIMRLDVPFEFAFGLNIGKISDELTLGGLKVSQSYTAFMIELLTRHMWSTGLFFGVRGGTTLVSANYQATGVDITGLTLTGIYGPAIGYEYEMVPFMSIVFDFAYLTVNGGELTFKGLGVVPFDQSAALVSQLGVLFHW